MAIIDSPAQLGSLMRETRVARGLSQRALAAEVGCSQRFISELERGKATAELGKALAVLKALGLLVEVSSRTDAVTALVERTEARLAAEARRTGRLADYLEA